jgi:hypothetical protein
MSGKGVAGLSLVVHFAPFSWLLFVCKNLWQGIEWWLIMPGALFTELLRIGLAHFQVEMRGGVWMLISFFISFALLTAIFLLMLRVPRWRIVVTLPRYWFVLS